MTVADSRVDKQIARPGAWDTGVTTDDAEARQPRIGILVVAYNAATTLAKTLDRIPVDFRSQIEEVFVCDDASDDHTYLVGLGYQQVTSDLPVTVIRHRRNLGYGGNQKAGYQLALEHDLDIVVLLHGDGQYAPELIPEIVAPLVRGEADAVFGSRMMIKGAARAGGMPLYKYVGNRILTTVENRALGSDLSEFHSGYRAYNVHALADLDLSSTSDGFNFDTQIIIKLLEAGKRITEIPIPTYYGDEICYVDGMKYARDVLTDVAEYRLAQRGFTSGDLAHVGDEYGLKESEGSSHTTIMGLLRGAPPLKILDLGCSGGLLAEQMRAEGHHVTGVDMLENPETTSRLDSFVQANLEDGIPAEVGTGYDLVILADVLEHVRDPQSLLKQTHDVIKPDGKVIISVPNFGHWYPRTRTVFGVFDYDQRGILDKGHVRFFTRRSLLRTIRNAGFDVLREKTVGLPLDVLQTHEGLAKRGIRAIDRASVKVRPTFFGYQFVMCLAPVPPLESVTYPRVHGATD